MKDLTPTQLARVTGPVTEPMFLVQIELDAPMHLSTHDTTTWNGQTWISGTLNLYNVNPEGTSLRIHNTDYRYTTPALQGAYQRKPVKIWQAYGTGQLANYFEPGYITPGYISGPPLGEPLLVFDGLISAIPEIGEWLRIELTRSPPRRYPRWRVLPPRANHLTPAGAVIVFGGESYRLESRQ